MSRRTVGILIFPDVEVLDFCGPFEVFSVARLDEGRRREEPSPYEVVLVAETTGRRRRHGRAEGRPRSHAGGLPAAGRAGRPRRLGDTPGDGERAADRLDRRAGAGRSRRWPRSAPARCCWARRGCSTASGRRRTGKSWGRCGRGSRRSRSSRRSTSSRTAASSPRRASRRGSTWPCGWSPGTTARRSPGRRPGTWNTPTRRTTGGGSDESEDHPCAVGRQRWLA